MSRVDDTRVEDDLGEEDHGSDQAHFVTTQEREVESYQLETQGDAELPSYVTLHGDFRAELDFWKWFATREPEIFESDDQNEDLFEEITERLGQVHECLGFEMTFDLDEFGRRELIVSTGGAIEAYVAVKRLVAMAPQNHERWQFVAFRPRRGVGGFLRVDEHYLEINKIRVSLQSLVSHLGVAMFFPSFNESESGTYTDAAHLILDLALGELNVLANIGPIDVFQLEEGAMNDLLSIEELPEAFDGLCRNLAEHYRLTHDAVSKNTESLINGMVELHRATFESLEHVINEAECHFAEFSEGEDHCFEFSLFFRFFSPSDFEASCLVSHLEPFVRIVELSSCGGPSLRGEGLVTTIECLYDPTCEGTVLDFLCKIFEVAVGCSSDVDVVQFDYDEVFSVIIKSVKGSVHQLIHTGQRLRAYQLLEDVEEEYLDDPEFWALFIFTCALLDKKNEVEKGLQHIRLISADQDFSVIPPRCVWLLASACALIGWSDDAGKFLDAIAAHYDAGEGWIYICEVLGEGPELNLISTTKEFQDFLGQLGTLH